MKIFSRDFSRTEKILIVVLVVLLLGLVYYQFVDKAVRASVDGAQAEKQALQTEIDIAQMRVQRLQSLKNTLDQLKEEGRMTYMASYNNSKPEVAFLNDILADTLSYSIEFDRVTRSGDQIRRSFKLSYMTSSFRVARNILDELGDGEFRCLVGDVSCAIANDGTTVVQANAIFYETMVGGTPDAGLPADAAAANS